MGIKLIIDFSSRLYFYFFFQLNCVLLSICLPILVSVSLWLALLIFFFFFIFFIASAKNLFQFCVLTSTLHSEMANSCRFDMRTHFVAEYWCTQSVWTFWKFSLFIVLFYCVHIWLNCVFSKFKPFTKGYYIKVSKCFVEWFSLSIKCRNNRLFYAKKI